MLLFRGAMLALEGQFPNVRLGIPRAALIPTVGLVSSSLAPLSAQSPPPSFYAIIATIVQPSAAVGATDILQLEASAALAQMILELQAYGLHAEVVLDQGAEGLVRANGRVGGGEGGAYYRG